MATKQERRAKRNQRDQEAFDARRASEQARGLQPADTAAVDALSRHVSGRNATRSNRRQA